MTGCFSTVLLLVLAVLTMVTLIRWFEQITDAVDHDHWSKVSLLIAVPLTAWLFESKVAAGRPFAVPRHEPIRGFGDTPSPPPVKKKRMAVDPDAIAKLKQKMKEQGMLEEKDEG
ncbi:MAG TPA: hypothetical protein VHD56_18180 [Tepidisphaeraceae bacterium]|nr:hypothetical protein [Tepidisphaeraceae bacterium]